MTRRQRSLTQQLDTANVKVQPRCGGHSFADYSIGGQDGSLVVDLKKLQKYEIDQTTWIAKVGGGTLLGDLTKRMHDRGGRAMSHGTCPQASAFGRSERFAADENPVHSNRSGLEVTLQWEAWVRRRGSLVLPWIMLLSARSRRIFCSCILRTTRSTE